MRSSTILAGLFANLAAAGGTAGRTFAVLHFYGPGPLMEGRVDPIVSPGVPSGHVHTVMGASNFGFNVTGELLRESSCTNSLIKADLSAYWFPKLYFHDTQANTFEPVDLFYANVYYFFEGTNDQIQAFPLGLKMVSGNAVTRTPPNTQGTLQLDPSQGTISPTQWTCPRSSFNPPSWPVGSDGSKAGIQDPGNQGSGLGFPFAECDGYASPLRMDLHFPSCYNPAAGLDNYKENMQFPTNGANNMQDCPAGWIHTPHIFFEVYWNTPKFASRWTPNQGSQPFILAEGDLTGFSAHGDFVSGWDETALQQIIDNCNAGDQGMDKCPGLIGGVNDPSDSCTIQSPVNENIYGVLQALPGNNPPSGWGIGTPPAAGGSSGGSGSGSSPSPSSPAAADPPAAQTSSPAGQSDVETTPPAAQNPPAASTPAPAATTPAPDSAGSPETVWSTVTEWITKTVYDDLAAAATPAPSSSPSANSSLPAVDGYTYAGCYQDASNRVLAGEIRPDLGVMTNDLCVGYCKGKGWALAGTEYGGQCYCGNSLVGSSKLADSSCDMPCEGDAAETCGGGWALTLYSVDGTASPPAGSAKAKRGQAQAHNHLLRHRSGLAARRR